MMNALPEDIKQEPIEPDCRYEFVVNGRLEQDIVGWFEDMTLTVDDSVFPAQTIIRGLIRDQAALYGFISRLRDLGLTLISMQKLDNEEDL